MIQNKPINTNNLADVVILSAASACNVNVVDVIGKSKKWELVMARAIAAKLLGEYDYGIRESARLINSDPKGVHTYVHTHGARMEDKKYARAYGLAQDFVEGYFTSDSSLREKFNQLVTEVMTIKSQYQHIKELLTTAK